MVKAEDFKLGNFKVEAQCERIIFKCVTLGCSPIDQFISNRNPFAGASKK